MGNLLSRSSSDSNKGSKRCLDVDEGTRSKRARVEERPLVKEAGLGIVAFVNPNLKGFHSILKYRAEDFIVHEVELDGKIVYLTSYDPPAVTKKVIQKEILAPAEFDAKVAHLLGDSFAKEFRAFLEKPEDVEATLTVDTTKEARLEFYELMEKHSDAKLYSRGKDGQLVIKWSSPQYYDEFVDWKAVGGNYLQAAMFKNGVDTMNAVNIISRKTGIQAKNIGFAGTKDARAITTQYITLKAVKPGRLVLAKEELNKSGIYLGNYSFAPRGLTLGDLKGNHFTIVLRDIKGITIPELNASLKSLKEHGFLNYFGMQRFGTSSVLTHEIGCAIMKKNYEEAVGLILNPRAGEREEWATAREHWQETKNADEALKLFPKRGLSERKLLLSLSKSPDNFKKAIKSLPKNMASLYSHAYQSYIWNKIVTERVRLFGADKPLVGDIVLVEGKKMKHARPVNDVGRRDFEERKVPKILTEKDVNDYSVFDVVYPLPGKQSVYPNNEIKEIYAKLLNHDGLSIEKSSEYFENLKGDYRCMLTKPSDMDWAFYHYNDPTAKLCNTDIENIERQPSPEDIEGGKYLALKVEFTLGTSQYATMALREIMRAETSSQAQSAIAHDD